MLINYLIYSTICIFFSHFVLKLSSSLLINHESIILIVTEGTNHLFGDDKTDAYSDTGHGSPSNWAPFDSPIWSRVIVLTILFLSTSRQEFYLCIMFYLYCYTMTITTLSIKIGFFFYSFSIVRMLAYTKIVF